MTGSFISFLADNGKKKVIDSKLQTVPESAEVRDTKCEIRDAEYEV